MITSGSLPCKTLLERYSKHSVLIRFYKLIKNFIHGSNPLVIMICNSIILLLEGDILMTSYKK